MIATVTLNPSLDEWIELPTLRIGALHRGQGFRRYPGGKGINVSRVIHELGARTCAYALAGGQDGVILRQLLDAEGVPCEFLTVQGATRNNYKILTRMPRALTEINGAGPRITATALAGLQRRVWRLHPGVVTLCGSLPPGVPATTYGRWIAALRRRQIAVVLDTSGDALRHGVAARPWLIKPNQREAEELLGRPLTGLRSAVRASMELSQRGIPWVLLSRGREGALLACADPPAVWQAVPPNVAARSAVGAGDSLVAGWLVGWLRGGTPQSRGRGWEHRAAEALRLGVACGTATALTPGTELCHRRDIHRLRRRVRIERLV